MMKLTISGKEYKVKYGYNCFCDTDLMDKVQELTQIFQSTSAGSDNDVSGIGKIKELFCVVRDLLFFGFKKYNPVDSPEDIGNLLDDYMDEESEEEKGLFSLFTLLSEELMSEGFLSDLLKTASKAEKSQAKNKK